MIESMKADVAIIGGGPAGLCAAAWCAELGLKAILIEREGHVGGQLHRIYSPIENYLGRKAINGEEMVRHFCESVERFDFVQLLGHAVDSIDLTSRCLRLNPSRILEYQCLIIATGVRRRRLGVPGEEEFEGRGILESGVRDRRIVAGKNVVIVGGGDAAIENALILSERARSVSVVHRRNTLRARDKFVQELQTRDNVSLLFGSVVTRILGHSHVSGVELQRTDSGELRTIAADALLVRIGVEPNSELVQGLVALSADGYIKVNAKGETSVAGVLAVGDVANPVSPTLQTAAGSGCAAAKSAIKWLK